MMEVIVVKRTLVTVIMTRIGIMTVYFVGMLVKVGTRKSTSLQMVGITVGVHLKVPRVSTRHLVTNRWTT